MTYGGPPAPNNALVTPPTNPATQPQPPAISLRHRGRCNGAGEPAACRRHAAARRHAAGSPAPLHRPRCRRLIAGGWGWVAGFVGGVTSALFGAGGPPYVIYLSQRGLSKEAFRATLGIVTMTSISVRVIAFFLTGLLLDAQVWLAALLAVP